MAYLELKRLNKIYPNGQRAIRDFSLSVNKGEFIVLVGPSGCGKSTILRMIAGLEEITTGELLIDGKLCNEVPAKDRNIAMVFQNYALYPHLTVFQNMAFGLQLAKLDKKEITKRVEDAAEMLGISELLSRKPSQLSGGQKQRVALGRAIVRKAGLYLFDEPLSNVDAKIRAEMRGEILRLHHKLNSTFIYVTHDQIEAMTMASRIVVLNHGITQQIGSPLEIYQEPNNQFVANFLGNPPMNMMEGEYKKEKDSFSIVLSESGKLNFPAYKPYELSKELKDGDKIMVGIRPDNISICEDKPNLTGEVYGYEYLGHERNVLVSYLKDTRPLSALISGDVKLASGMKVGLHLDEKTVHLFDKETGESLLGVVSFQEFRGAKLTGPASLLSLSFLNSKVTYPYYESLIDKAIVGHEVKMVIDSKAISLTSVPNALCLKVKVRHLQNLINAIGVYASLEDGRNIAFYAPKDNKTKEGDELSVYIPNVAIEIRSLDNELLSAKFPLFKNEVQVLKKGNKVEIEDFKFAGSLNDGTYVLDPNGASLSGRKGLKCLVLDDQSLGKKCLVYLKSKKGTYLNVLLPAPFDRHEKPYIRLVFDVNSLKKED
jgi:multiple sugar transport system ATP-binding protein